MRASKTSSDSELGQRSHNHAYINSVSKVNEKAKANKCNTSGDNQTLKMLLDTYCSWLVEGIDYEAMGLKWRQGILIPLSYVPGLDNHNHANQLRTISPCVLLTDREIPLAL